MHTPRIPSPYGLIQEELRDDPWKLLIACMLLNLTSIKQVRPIIPELFRAFPDASSAANADKSVLVNILRPLGFYNRRAASVIRMSEQFIAGRWHNVVELHGIGKYASDSHRIFCEGMIDVDPTDIKLLKYVAWAKELQNGKGENEGSELRDG